MGRSAYFIRLFGCPVKCPWCDSAGTWHPEYVPKDVGRVESKALAGEAKKAGAEIVIVTGGEPAIHDLSPLTRCLREQGQKVHLETSGGFEIKGQFDWITLSPKWQRLPLAKNLELASEFKLIIENEDSIEKWTASLGSRFGKRSVWLHPEWSQRNSPAVLGAITSWVKAHGSPFRAGYQLHKLFRADELDPHSLPGVPLGGNSELGY